MNAQPKPDCPICHGKGHVEVWNRSQEYASFPEYGICDCVLPPDASDGDAIALDEAALAAAGGTQE